MLGSKGTGKTTLIHTLLGMIPSDKGSTQLFGSEDKVFSPANKQKIGLVTQELTAKENLEFFAGIYGLKGEERKKKVKEVLAFVGLSSNDKKTQSKLSGGVKRRLNIACALTHRPQLLIMDEPTVGIDPQSINHTIVTVKKLREL